MSGGSRVARVAKAARLVEGLAFVVVVALLVLAALGPFAWMVLSSILPRGQLYSVDTGLVPRSLDLGNYVRVFTRTSVPVYFRNSLTVALTTTLVVIVLAALAAYSLTRFRYPGREAVSQVILFTYMFPSILLLIPLYVMVARLRLTDSYPGLVITHITFSLPFAVWLLRGVFLSVPFEIEEAAMIDGCTRLGSLARVVLPLSSPGLTATALFTFMHSWNEYLFAFVLTRSESLKTLPIGLAGFITSFESIDWGGLMAASTVATLPIVVSFLALQKYLVEGLTAGAVKG